MSDLMGEQEAIFLSTALPLFRSVKEYGRAAPRARVSMVRAYKPVHAIDAMHASADVVHLIAHGVSEAEMTREAKRTMLQRKGRDLASDEYPGPGLRVGAGNLSSRDLKLAGVVGLRLPEILVSTVCQFDSSAWLSTLKVLGVKVIIASKADVAPADLAAFDMAFYSAFLAQIYKKHSTIERAEKAFEHADNHYRAIHAIGSDRAPFAIRQL